MIPALTPMLSALGPFALLLVMAVVFAETGLLVGFFLPGDSLLFTAGVLTATGVISLPMWVMALGVFVAAAAGDQLGYRIGRRLGPRLFTRQDSRLFARDHAVRAALLVERYGAKAVVLARFIPVARTFTPVVAGVGRMTPSRFTAYNLAGALAWGVGVLLAGFYLGGVAFVAAHVELIILFLVAISLVPAAVAFASHRRSQLDPQSDEAELVRPSMHAGV
jgi:membrane-associated protein